MAASPPKKENSVEGYIHAVSGILEGASKRKYFTACIQEATAVSKVVVFQIQQHQLFTNAEKHHSPVRLENVMFKASRQNPGENDIIAGVFTKVSSLRCLPFPCDTFKKTSDVQMKTIAEIIKDPTEYQRVHVQLRIMERREHGEGLTRSKKKLKKSVFAVADATGSLLLTVWGDAVVEVGKWYNLQNVSVRLFYGKAALTTTMQTTVQEAPDAGQTVKAVSDETQTISGEIISGNVTVHHYCPKYHIMEGVNAMALMTKCESCGTFVKNVKLHVEVKGRISVEDENGEEKSFELNDQMVRSVLHFKSSAMPDADELVAQLLQHNRAKITFCHRRATELVLLKDDLVGDQHTAQFSKDCASPALACDDNDESASQQTKAVEAGKLPHENEDVEDMLVMLTQHDKTEMSKEAKESGSGSLDVIGCLNVFISKLFVK
ncbi:hypothetical protein AMEX_G5988 [Astyanax mexicanus]|uniref:Replication protein A OB domain-containing protein n=1 Tax=Astyanax mexicanus TaxID=7994 RepID=A0A8T2M3E8_ASTMX|nr:hypothetical protein AMEX_G5988 [Astyanax mexicanus]